MIGNGAQINCVLEPRPWPSPHWRRETKRNLKWNLNRLVVTVRLRLGNMKCVSLGYCLIWILINRYHRRPSTARSFARTVAQPKLYGKFEWWPQVMCYDALSEWLMSSRVKVGSGVSYWPVLDSALIAVWAGRPLQAMGHERPAESLSRLVQNRSISEEVRGIKLKRHQNISRPHNHRWLSCFEFATHRIRSFMHN